VSALAEALEALGLRIERLVADPDTIGLPFTRLFRPFMFRFGWKPELCTLAFEALIALGNQDDREAMNQALAEAVDEFTANVRQIERATVVNKRPLVSYATWLRRVYEVLVNVERAVERNARVVYRYRQSYLPPMTLNAAEAIEDAAETLGEQAEEEGAESPVDQARLLELQLDTVDALLASARGEDESLGRRRRLLEAARQTLLETSAVLDLDGQAVEERLQHIATQITRLNRMQALGLREDAGLLFQARTALTRGERDKLHAALTVLQEAAVDRGDTQVTELTGKALQGLVGDGVPSRGDMAASLEQSGAEVMGDPVVKAVQDGYAKLDKEGIKPTGDKYFDNIMADFLEDYLAPGAVRATLSCALTVDGCFDVGGAMSPVRVKEQYLKPVMVRHPMPDMTLVQARRPEDLRTAILQDPRSVVLDLAAGRLLTRRYVRMDVATRDKTVMQGEVRVYLLDGSGSMNGPRARMRDAILVAELATLARRLGDPDRNTRVVVYFRYFNHDIGPVHRVDSVGGALQAIKEVTSTLRQGGTDLQGAMLASMQLVRDEEQADPDLRNAQIVLVTDGDAPVDEVAIEAARQEIGGVPLGISVIALGIENPALRDMVAHQRGMGDRAFYHFLPDAFLKRVADGDIDSGPPIHLPKVQNQYWTDAELDTHLDGLLDELEEVQRDRRGASLAVLQADDPASLGRRFMAWFPEPDEADLKPDAKALWPEEGTLEHEDLESCLVLLASVAECIESIGSSALERQRDALEMMESLLPHARLTPARYQEVVRLYPAALSRALEVVHAVAREGFWARLEHPE